MYTTSVNRTQNMIERQTKKWQKMMKIFENDLFFKSVFKIEGIKKDLKTVIEMTTRSRIHFRE